MLRERLTARFTKHVEKTDSCWWWRGAKKRGTYGQLSVNGKMMYAHRAAWFLAHGQWPEQFVCHTCDNRACVNPDHLFLGTHEENMADARSKNRIHPGEAHGMAKLSLDQVREVRHLIADGVPQRRIAREMACSQAGISAIATGRNWARS